MLIQEKGAAAMRKYFSPVLAIIASAGLAAAIVTPAVTRNPVIQDGAPAAAADPAAVIYACLTTSHTLARVSTGTPAVCAAGQVPVSWPGTAGSPAPGPSPTISSASSSPSMSPSPSASPSSSTSPSPSPSSTGTFSCTVSSPSGVCGAYLDAQIINSNGFDTYVSNNCWADPSCQQVIRANGPGDWQVTADEPAEPGGNTPGNCADGVKTYPEAQQLFNNWTGPGTGPGGTSWNGPGAQSDTPIGKLASLSSTYAETMPHGTGTVAEFAWDIWLSSDSGFPGEVMVWTDNTQRESGGAAQVAGPVIIGSQDWTLYQNGSGELIWSLGAPGTFAQQGSGTVDLLALLNWLRANGHAAAGAAIGQADAGWEICSTGGSPAAFSMTSYSITGA